MKHTYAVTGMTCNGCKSSVEKAILNLREVDKVEVDLNDHSVSVHSEKPLPLEYIQGVLPEKYAMTDLNMVDLEGSTKSELKQLKPLFLIIGYISMAAVGLHYKSWDWDAFMLDFMGLFYIVFSFFKLLDLKGFPESFRMYDPLAKALPAYATIYPFIEVALGLLFLLRVQVTLALVATIVILGITTVGVTRSLSSKRAIECACLGTALKLPMTKATFIENVIMILMAIIMLLG